MKIICEIRDNSIYTLNGGFIGSIPASETIKEFIEVDSHKTRVKQALKLKEAGFNGKEIIEIIGELE